MCAGGIVYEASHKLKRQADGQDSHGRTFRMCCQLKKVNHREYENAPVARVMTSCDPGLGILGKIVCRIRIPVRFCQATRNTDAHAPTQISRLGLKLEIPGRLDRSNYRFGIYAKLGGCGGGRGGGGRGYGSSSYDRVLFSPKYTKFCVCSESESRFACATRHRNREWRAQTGNLCQSVCFRISFCPQTKPIFEFCTVLWPRAPKLGV